MTTKTALCVGLNYPKTSAQLAGCVNDARDWQAALSARGYDARILLEPTKAQLVAALTELITPARFGDRVVFTYSGHGTYLADRNGDEADRRDEALVCADYRTGGVLVDDELNALFSAARYGVRRLIFSDSCHSGTVSRMVADSSIGTPRFLPPQGLLTDLSLERSVNASSAVPKATSGEVLISGCADIEYSYDAWFGGRANGAFTRVALDTLADNPRTLAAWHKAIRLRLPSIDYRQSPQLTAKPHQRYWAL